MHGNFGESRRSLLKQAALSPTIFHEPWWLELACSGNYREVQVEVGGRLVGRLPYLQTTFARQTILKMPSLTHVLGPAVVTEAGPGSRVSKEVGITTKLIKALPKAAHTSFRLHGGTSNTLAFEAAGYKCGVQFSIELAPAPYDKLWKQMRDKTRNSVRRAQDVLTVVEMKQVADFLDFYESNLSKRNAVNHYSRLNAHSVIVESISRGVGRIIAANDNVGRLQSAIFTVWDHRSAYYLLSTRVSDSMNGATSLLIWHAIVHAAERGLSFDMDGIHVLDERMPNLLLLSGFGGSIVPRFTVRRASPMLEAIRGLVRRP